MTTRCAKGSGANQSPVRTERCLRPSLAKDDAAAKKPSLAAVRFLFTIRLSGGPYGAQKFVVGLFESKGIAEDARNRLETEGVPASDISLKVLRERSPLPSTMEPEVEASFLSPVILGNFREIVRPIHPQWRDYCLRPGGRG